MAIESRDDYLASTRQRAQIIKTATRTVIAAQWFSVFDLNGNPGAGTLAGGNTANGVVPTDATAGYPPINTFGGGAKGYLSRLDAGSAVACRLALYDRLFVAGAYAFNANTALASQPSYSGRLPVVGGNPDYKNLEIWVEQVTAATGNQAVNVTYTDQDGNAGATTGATGIGSAPTVGRCWQLPFASGDCGVQAITNVAGSVASAGTFNVMVLRPIIDVRIKIPNDGILLDLFDLGLPEIYDTSALYALVAADATSSGVFDLNFEIANR